MSGWRGLAVFWGVVILLLIVAGGVLQVLGPPRATSPMAEAPDQHEATPAAQPAMEAEPRVIPHAGRAEPADAVRQITAPLRPGRGTPGPIADPDPAMLEPVADDPRLPLPRISIDGRASMAAYAAGFDPSTLRPRVGLMIAGIGLDEADSLAAIKALPGGVTLAIASSAGDLGPLLAAARANEHEYLLSVPMEPRGFPIRDPDDQTALMTSVTPTENMARLRATLGGMTGYAGVTNARGAMHGERLAGVIDPFDPILREVAARGLFFLDARTAHKPLPYAWSRSVDMVMDDDPPDAPAFDQQLDALTHLAQAKGSALGVVSAPRPVSVDRVAAWANTLASKGLALAPVSALMLPPAKQDQKQ